VFYRRLIQKPAAGRKNSFHGGSGGATSSWTDRRQRGDTPRKPELQPQVRWNSVLERALRRL
jgi:hypothetical protein